MSGFYSPTPTDSHALLREQNAAANMPQMRQIIDRQSAKIKRQAGELTAKEKSLVGVKQQLTDKERECDDLQRKLDSVLKHLNNAKTWLHKPHEATPAHVISAKLEIEDARRLL